MLFPLLHGPGDPRLCNAAVTPSEESVLSTSEDQSRRFSRTSAEGRSPFLLVHAQHRVPPWPTERQLLSHPNTLGSHVLAVSSETVARYGQVQGRCSLCLSVLQWQHKTANGDGSPSEAPSPPNRWLLQTVSPRRPRCCTSTPLQYPPLNRSAPWGSERTRSICPGICTLTLSQNAPDWESLRLGPCQHAAGWVDDREADPGQPTRPSLCRASRLI